MLPRLAHRRQPHRIALVAAGQRLDGARNGGGKHQRAAVRRRRLQDEFEIVAEAEVEHLVGLVEHDGAQRRHVQRMAGDVVAQPPRRADHDMRAPLQRAPLGAHVHAADAGGHHRACFAVEPFELALNLKGKFARRRHGKRKRRSGSLEAIIVAKQVGSHRQTEGNRLARSGLRRDQRVAPGKFRRDHGGLDRGQCVEAALLERIGKRWQNAWKLCQRERLSV